MVSLIKHIRTPNGERRLTQKLDCMGLWWYLRAPCKNCDNYYVGQTMTSKQCNVGLNIERYGTKFVTLEITIIGLN